jgi:tetratricopeptide (TPR) repeat protein
MNTPSSTLNAVLRIESTEGFTLKFKHPVFGELYLPIADPGAIVSMTADEKLGPSGEAIAALNRACQAFVEKRDLKSAFAEAEVFSKRYPTFALAYSLMGGYAEGMGQLEQAAFHNRQAIAIRPDFSFLAKLGQILGKQGKLEDSLVIYLFLFENRKKSSSDGEAIHFLQGLLVTLTRLQRGEDMVRVSDVAIADYGGATIFHYQAILGLMLSKSFQPAMRRLMALEPHLNPTDPLLAKFAQLKQILTKSLNAQGGNSPPVVKVRYFIAGLRPVKIKDTPNGKREFGIDWKTGEFIKTDLYIRKIFRDHSPDIDEVDLATFEKRVTKIRAKIRDRF